MSEAPEAAREGLSGQAIDLQDALKVLVEEAMPLEVGRIDVGPEGAIRRRDAGLPLQFSFAYMGAVFDARLDTEDATSLNLRTNLGKLPYTAESSVARRVILRLIACAGRLPRGRIFIDECDDLLLEADIAPPKPQTPVSIMAAVTTLLLDAKPYLELLAEAWSRSSGPVPVKT